MNKIISKQELNDIMKIKGEIRGFGLETTLNFLIKEEGKEGLEKLEKAMAEIDCPTDFRNIKLLEFYPLKWF